MRKLAFTGIIIQPSVASFTTVIIFSTLTLLSTILNIGGVNDGIYRILLGNETSYELIDSTKSIVSEFSNILFNNPLLNRLLFFSFWLFVGLLVYILISGVGLSLGAAQKIHDDEKLLNSHKDSLQRDFKLRLILRAATVFAWVMYMAVFFKIFLPFSVLTFKVAVGGILSATSVGIGALGFAVLMVSLHLHVVLLRCLLLRPRSIGGWDDIVAAKLD